MENRIVQENDSNVAQISTNVQNFYENFAKCWDLKICVQIRALMKINQDNCILI